MTWQSLTPLEKRDRVRTLVETNGLTYLQAAQQLGIQPNMIAGVIDRAKRAKQPIKTTSGHEFGGRRGKPKIRKAKKKPPTAVNTTALNARRRKAQRPKHSTLSPRIVTPPAITVEPTALHPSAWLPLPGSRPVAITDHASGCRWPLDSEPPLAALFCNLPAHDGGVYCRAHARLAFREPPAKIKRKETA